MEEGKLLVGCGHCGSGLVDAQGICRNRTCPVYEIDIPELFAEMDLLLESL